MRRAILFALGDDRFGLPLEVVREVLRPVWPMPLPRPPFGCLGAIDVRGQWVPLMDLGALLGIRGGGGRRHLEQLLSGKQVLLATIGEGPLALLVDAVLDVGEEDAPGPDGPTPFHRAGGSPADLASATDVVAGAVTAERGRGLILRPEALIGPQRRRLLRDAVARLRDARGASA